MDSFEVENFRSLKHLKLEKLARVNLLVGKNNSGKTSVLEGMYLFAGTNIGAWIDHMDAQRKMTLLGFAYLFYRFKSQHILKFKAHIKPSVKAGFPFKPYNISVAITPEVELNNPSGLLPGSIEEAHLYRSNLEMPFEAVKKIVVEATSTENKLEPSSKEEYRASDYFIRRQERNALVEKVLLQPVFGHWLGTNISVADLYKRIEYVQVAKREQVLLELVQLIDLRVQRIRLASGDIIYLDLGPEFPTLSPLALTGDGVQQSLAIIAAMAHTPGAIIFIDEIDNGLHYSALRILWKGILQAAREYDVQVFATTHSAEALRHLTWVLDEEENASYRDDVAAYTLIRADDDTVRTYRHDYEQLEYALDHGVEIRN